ncbi:MAG: porin family protein [Acidobacteriota bacterium]|nr:porin family protein [Acidobacteriota bacterium]
MSKQFIISILLTGALVLPLTSAAQSSRFDLSAGASAVFSKISSGNGTTDTPTNSLGFVATARHRFSAKHSLAVNYGRTKNSQIYSTPPFFYRIQASVSEYSGAYMFSPVETEKFEPYLFAGAGALVFHPTNTFIDGFQVPVAAARQTEIAFLYGAGVDYRIHSFFGLRLQYRGLIYRAPDFSFPGFLTSARGHLAEPSIGLVFKF